MLTFFKNLATGILLVASLNVYASTYTDLGTLTGIGSVAESINDVDQIVGYYVTPGTGSGIPHAAIWNGTIGSDVGTFTTNPANSTAEGINDSGVVVGLGRPDVIGPTHAMLWNGSTETTLFGSGGTQSAAVGINNAGLIVGWSFNAGVSSATLWHGTTPTDIGPPDTISFARAVNNNDQIAGYSLAPFHGETQAIRWEGTTPTYLGSLPGSNFSAAFAINDSGQVAGETIINSQGLSHATIWNGTTATDLDPLNVRTSEAFGINNAGEVVGYSQISNVGIPHATLWDGTTKIDLNGYLDTALRDAGWVLGTAYDINNNGQVVGVAENVFSFESHAYLLSITGPPPFPLSIPEPGTYALMLSGLGFVGWVSRRKRQSFI